MEHQRDDARRRGEAFVPFSTPRHLIPMVTEFRSTWLASSLRVLRDRGALDRYYAALPPAARDSIRSSVAGTWLPVSLAMDHYRACASLGFSTPDQMAIGSEVMRFAQRTSFAVPLKLATGAGVTPWLCFEVQPRLWKSVWRGGDVAVFRLGPKEARVEIVGWPCAAISYCRIAMRGLLTSQTELFCKKAYVSDIVDHCSATALGFRIAWA